WGKREVIRLGRLDLWLGWSNPARLSPVDEPRIPVALARGVSKAKLQEYIDNGARLGWLIDPQNQQVWVYRPGQGVDCLEQPVELSGEDVLPGFILPLARIW
ncbi:Uma2 family endonuclease, partial [Spirulina sp. CCNP1310]|uniref:Uma2 family endonuclease n=1 Tax=Spirulina sp. CCNP1310 TaxID=3110249 RepID=UPI002B20ADC1